MCDGSRSNFNAYIRVSKLGLVVIGLAMNVNVFELIEFVYVFGYLV